EYNPSIEDMEAVWQARLMILQRVVSYLNRFKFRAEPRLQIKFSGDIAQLENARVEATLRCEWLQRGNYQIRDLALAGEYSDQTLSVTQCEWLDDLSRIAGNAVWRGSTGDLECQAQSSLNAR